MKTAQDFASARNVSRETLEKLAIYEKMLRKWTPAINLVARSTLEQLWSRHFLDSAQVYDLAPKNGGHWVDLGSGGGFPGMVAAILATEEQPEIRFSLVESDGRKAAFLSAVAQATDIKVAVIPERVESLAGLGADILTARALAPLDQLLLYADKHLKPAGTALFPKGVNYASEMRQALEKWQFSCIENISKTNPAAVVLTIGGIKRV
ncbi:MAG: 16S rRNA (guanine(527)-N(7))-methyltransferase RsmG [Rhodobacteraceae bacterium]|nr:16S rRNA (guanine(527)-N(7))-methyltransferase RsmG [Paracoccaceae bacterium]MCP5341394.1 16S rRNA (guanine(527)-N(7))-methyltransferase RsmG [Paracoccaceae bacterium]